MKPLALATFAASLLAVLLASTGLSLAMNLDYALARYPTATSAGSEHLNLLSAPVGYISQQGVYQTRDDVMSVWRWYGRHLDVEPAAGMGAEGPCVTLTRATQHLFIRRTIGVLLCAFGATHRTLVSVSQAVYLQR